MEFGLISLVGVLLLSVSMCVQVLLSESMEEISANLGSFYCEPFLLRAGI